VNAEATFAALVHHFSETPGVDVPAGRGFGSGALKVGGSIFAMHAHDRVVLKPPASRVAELIDEGVGEPYSAGKATPMKHWVALTTDDDTIAAALAAEALAFVGR
jgi:hypothetical protein